MNIPEDKMEEFEAAALDAVERKMDEPEYRTGGLDLEEATFLAARTAVEAAREFIASHTLREAARDFEYTDPIETALGGQGYPIEWLEDRAAGMEGES